MYAHTSSQDFTAVLQSTYSTRQVASWSGADTSFQGIDSLGKYWWFDGMAQKQVTDRQVILHLGLKSQVFLVFTDNPPGIYWTSASVSNSAVVHILWFPLCVGDYMLKARSGRYAAKDSQAWGVSSQWLIFMLAERALCLEHKKAFA